MSCQLPSSISVFILSNYLYFSGVEHQQADWVGIHEKICQLLIPLRTPHLSFLSSEEQRKKREQDLVHRQVGPKVFQRQELR